MGVTLLPPSCSAQVGFSLDWTSSSRSSGIQKDPENPIVLVHVDDLKLCPGPQDISWILGVPTAKSLYVSTVAFRPGSHMSDTAPDPSVDVSGWEDMNYDNTSSTVIKDLNRPIDITGHVLSPFNQCNLDYQDCRFHSIAHLMCCRYGMVNCQRTFTTGISLTFPRLTLRHVTVYNSGTLYWWTYTAICASLIQLSSQC